MGADRTFWYFFGGIFLLVGILFLFGAFGINLFADPKQLDGAPAWVFGLAGLVAAGGGGYVIRRALRDRAREQRLLKDGQEIQASVIDIHRSRVEINRRSRWYVSYRYSFGGRDYTGESHVVSAEWVGDFKPGDRVRILVDPARPEDTLFMGP